MGAVMQTIHKGKERANISNQLTIDKMLPQDPLDTKQALQIKSDHGLRVSKISIGHAVEINTGTYNQMDGGDIGHQDLNIQMIKLKDKGGSLMIKIFQNGKG